MTCFKADYVQCHASKKRRFIQNLSETLGAFWTINKNVAKHPILVTRSTLPENILSEPCVRLEAQHYPKMSFSSAGCQLL